MAEKLTTGAGARRHGALIYFLGVAVLMGGILVGAWWTMDHGSNDDAGNAFAQAMASGKTYYEKGEPTKAQAAFQSALAMNPANPDVHLNLANAFLHLNQPEQAAIHARETIQFEPANPAAWYVLGCAQLRQNQYSNAVQSLQEAKNGDRTINPVTYQLGRALAGWGHHEEAIEQFRELQQFETNTAAPQLVSSHYLLAQSLLRLGQREAAEKELAEHQKLTAVRASLGDDPAVFETCLYTEIRAPFPLEQPGRDGVSVKFVDATSEAFGSAGKGWHGPMAVMDINRRGWNDLLIPTATGVQLLWNSNGVFDAYGPEVPIAGASGIRDIVVGDLQNDRYEDAVLIGTEGISTLRFATNGAFVDSTRTSRLGAIKGRTGVLADLDFTGKLGLEVIGVEGRLRSFTNLGTGLFREAVSSNASPALRSLTNLTSVAVNDWNNDDLPDLIVTREGSPPALLMNHRGTGIGDPETPEGWPVTRALAVADLNNDLRSDIALLTDKSIDLYFGGLKEPTRLSALRHQLSHIRLIDYDNDGWLDIVAWGAEGIRVWRNRGHLGFHEMTSTLGLDRWKAHAVNGLAIADFDRDGDLDFIADVVGEGLVFLRNEGGNANGLLKLQLLGNRSNASGLGVKIEASAAGWHALRFVDSLPVTLGVGKRKQLDSVTTRWFETKLDNTDVTIDAQEPLVVFELVIPGGSCPYLYAGNGTNMHFVTDVLAGSPAGLPVMPGRFIAADPTEYVWLGNDQSFVPSDGRYHVRLTEELKEILYLDYARLVVADHPTSVEVHPTSRMLPFPPFVPHGLVGLTREIPLRSAVTLDGTDVTEDLRSADGKRVSPSSLRGPQYRGLAEPHGIVLDFGPLGAHSPLSLVLNGWIRFGGGMANIAASHNPEFPFPFPKLEAEVGGDWQPVDVQVGVPAGKTKTIVVDLTDCIPAGTQRLRLTDAFELHWDRIALFGKSQRALGNIAEGAEVPLNAVPGPAPVRCQVMAPLMADLHRRGYSAYAELPWTEPLTPIYDQLRKPPYQLTPFGWATRYGSVGELLATNDQALVIIAGGDELALEFSTDGLATPPTGWVRDYFLCVVGWDKDADYHVAAGDTIEPLPWRGMDDQQYGHQERPVFPSDGLQQRMNTRWVGPRPMARRGEVRVMRGN